MTIGEAIPMGLWVLGTALGVRALAKSTGQEGVQVRRHRLRAWGDLVVLLAIPLIVFARPPVLRDSFFYPLLLLLAGGSLWLHTLGRNER